MSSATVATIACLALAAAAGTAVWVALQQRRTDELSRSLTSRKWEIITLRAELGALRRQVSGDATSPGPPADQGGGTHRRNGAHDVDGHGADGHGADGHGADGHDADGEHRSGVPAGPAPIRAPAGTTPSPTAWRRDRARAATSRPRRRRLF